MTSYTGTPPAGLPDEDLVAGRFRFRVVYRHAGSDEGLTIHVFGPAQGSIEEVLRFDCFADQPHYHLGWSYRNQPFVTIDAAEPFPWALGQLESNVESLLANAGAEAATPEELRQLSAVLRALSARVRADSLELVAQCPRRVHEISIRARGGTPSRALGPLRRLGRCTACSHTGMLRVYRKDPS